MNPQQFKSTARPLSRAALLLLGALGLANAALAQLTDVANVPLSTTAPTVIKPNVMFILDDSGSMAWDYMPDDARFPTTRYGRNASQCNGVAYNPAATYRVPVDSLGNPYPDGIYTFTTAASLADIHTVSSAAPMIATGSVTVRLTTSSGTGDYSTTRNNNGNYFVTLFDASDPSRWMIGDVTAWDSGNRDLTVNVRLTSGTGTLANARVGDGDNRPIFYTYSGSNTPLSYTYSTSGVITNPTPNFYQECDSVVGTLPGVFTETLVTPAYSRLDNYRNWYTYHRTRTLTMRSAASQAFRSIDNRYRVGFSTISTPWVSGANFLDVDDFGATHKADFYSRLFGANPSGSTPLRGALSKAGKYFAKRARVAGGSTGGVQVYDPMQYSCQRNYAILTTDGYWNTGAEVNSTGLGSYGPDRLDNTDVGQQDGGTTPRPMKDFEGTFVEARTSTLQRRTITPQFTTSTRTLQSSTRILLQETSANSGSTWTAPAVVGSCTWDNSGSTRTRCSYAPTWSAPVTVPAPTACTAVALGTGTSGTWNTGVQCSYSAPVNTTTTSCTPATASPGPTNYTVNPARTCTDLTIYGPWTNTASCTASTTNGCQYDTWTPWTEVASCSAQAQSAGPTSYTVGTARQCLSTVSTSNDNTLADVAMYYYQTDLRTEALANCDSFAYGNPTNVCRNNLTPSGMDDATHQHMTTFTLGMGLGGLLPYRPDYGPLNTSGAYYDITQGTRNWPVAGPSADAENVDDLWHAAVNGRGRYFSAGNPDSLAQSLSSALMAIQAEVGAGSGAAASTLQPVEGDNKLFIAKYLTVHWIGDLVARSIDPQSGAISGPLWSAARQLQARVDGGTPRDIRYFARTSGVNTGTLRPFTQANLAADGLGGNFSNACGKVPALTQCATLTPAELLAANSGDNMVNYLSGATNPLYRTRYTVDTDITGGILGDIIGGAPVYVGQPSFRYTENDYAGFVATQLATNPTPAVTVPPTPPGRRGVVYTASNDGMLHVFDGATGEELWAYVPTMVMNRMYRLADRDYANRHEFFVNGAPTVGDIFVPGSPGRWKTILVGGLGAGGRGYYALDITDPANPISLWEFSNDSLGGNDNLGLSFGNPVITKRADGTWVVVFSSGYNNVLPGDGNGRLFVVNANTGQRITSIPTYTTGTTPAGTVATPSGLGKINVWIDSEIDNSARRFYGGDVLGNLWRFDIDNLVAPNQTALRLAYFNAGGVAQPITTQPSLAEVNYGGSRFPVVYVGTGKYLGTSDLSSTAVQTVYAIKDPLTNTPLGDVHASASVIAQTLGLSDGAVERSARTVTNNAVNWATDNGWKIDLALPTTPRPLDAPLPAPWPPVGERVNVDMQLLFNTLSVATNIPSDDLCSVGGSSYLYQFDIGTGSGQLVNGSYVAGRWLGNSMVVGMSWVTLQLPGQARGSGRTITITVDNRGNPRTDDVPPPPPPTGSGRRTSWRELVQ
ncbi:MAG: PilC/PilY family type IV pilus protein [Burkholderiaceae bacterium]|nr:PilC/PilY family type IV pilus protein [Burkholderiaceae bacterium]